jgi:hypothetical protein
MGFWDTFIKVWHVRASIRIQEGLGDAIRRSADEENAKENGPKIVRALSNNKILWDREMEYQRNQKNKGK